MLSLGRMGDMMPEIPVAWPGRGANGPEATGLEETGLRQLRHLTKNALQRILAQVIETPGIEASPAGRRLAREIERRIKLSAAISDALFGLTGSPDAFSLRLSTLARSVIDLYADPAQIIRLRVAVRSIVPAGLEPALLGIVHELIGNAVKHGFHMRLVGEVAINLENAPDGRLVLAVANDGWPIEGDEKEGEGLALVRELAARVQGRVRTCSGPPTVIEVRLPTGNRA